VWSTDSIFTGEKGATENWPNAQSVEEVGGRLRAADWRRLLTAE